MDPLVPYGVSCQLKLFELWQVCGDVFSRSVTHLVVGEVQFGQLLEFVGDLIGPIVGNQVVNERQHLQVPDGTNVRNGFVSYLVGVQVKLHQGVLVVIRNVGDKLLGKAQEV